MPIGSVLGINIRIIAVSLDILSRPPKNMIGIYQIRLDFLSIMEMDLQSFYSV